MERRAQLAVLVLSIRTNLRSVNETLEELNGGHRERTYPKALSRAFRAMEHDARVVGLARLGDVLAQAKEASQAVLDAARGAEIVELLAEAAGELARVADDVEAGRRHRIDDGLAKRLARAAGAAGRGADGP